MKNARINMVKKSKVKNFRISVENLWTYGNKEQLFCKIYLCTSKQTFTGFLCF